MADLEKIFNKKFISTDDMEELISSLQSAGANIQDTVMLIKNKTALTLQEADTIVVNSNTWSAEKEQVLRFRDMFWDILDDNVPDQ